MKTSLTHRLIRLDPDANGHVGARSDDKIAATTRSERPDLGMVALELLNELKLGRSAAASRLSRQTRSPSQYLSIRSLPTEKRLWVSASNATPMTLSSCAKIER